MERSADRRGEHVVSAGKRQRHCQEIDARKNMQAKQAVDLLEYTDLPVHFPKSVHSCNDTERNVDLPVMTH